MTARATPAKAKPRATAAPRAAATSSKPRATRATPTKPRSPAPPRAPRATAATSTADARATPAERAAPTRRPGGRRATFHHGDLRRALIGAALDLVAEGQGETFTLREAARRVGVNHRAVYHHFADKRALLAAAVIEGWHGQLDEIRAELARQPVTQSTRDRLLAIGRAYVRYALARPAHYRAMFGARLNTDGRFADLEAVLGEAIQLVAVEVRRGIERAELPPGTEVLQATMTLWATVHGIADLLIEGRIQVRPARALSYAELLLRPVVAGLELA